MAFAPDEPDIGIAQAGELAAVRALIVAGLTQRWGDYDLSMNPDLEAFEATYRTAAIVVAKRLNEIVGCGILIGEGPRVGRIVRMSVAGDRQRRGIGGRVLHRLFDEALRRGYTHVMLETSADWHSALSFYERHGFVRTELRDGDQHFCFDLAGHRR